jgi:hypothetical protein
MPTSDRPDHIFSRKCGAYGASDTWGRQAEHPGAPKSIWVYATCPHFSSYLNLRAAMSPFFYSPTTHCTPVTWQEQALNWGSSVLNRQYPPPISEPLYPHSPSTWNVFLLDLSPFPAWPQFQVLSSVPHHSHQAGSLCPNPDTHLFWTQEWRIPLIHHLVPTQATS